MERQKSQGLSEKDVVRYLRQQASLQKDKRWGNPALAQALERLASKLEAEMADAPRSRQSQLDLHSWPTVDDLRRIELSAIPKLIRDENITKAELVELAFVRFSIPRSRLQRLRMEDIRDVIQAAAEHEASITIIGREAERQGSGRRS
jgi:hypothetical protein